MSKSIYLRNLRNFAVEAVVIKIPSKHKTFIFFINCVGSKSKGYRSSTFLN